MGFRQHYNKNYTWPLRFLEKEYKKFLIKLQFILYV